MLEVKQSSLGPVEERLFESISSQELENVNVIFQRQAVDLSSRPRA